MSISSVQHRRGPRRQDMPLWRRATGSPTPPQGVFETLLVVGGEPVELGGHLARLGRSLEAVYARELPAAGRGEARATAAEGLELGRLRLTARPGPRISTSSLRGSTVDPAVIFPSAARRSRQLTRSPAGYGSHKWVDRRDGPPRRRPRSALICDGDEAAGGRLGQPLRGPRGDPLDTPARRPHPPRHRPSRRPRAGRGRGTSRRRSSRSTAEDLLRRRRDLPHQLHPRHRAGHRARRNTRPPTEASGPAQPSPRRRLRRRWNLCSDAPASRRSRPESRSALSLNLPKPIVKPRLSTGRLRLG